MFMFVICLKQVMLLLICDFIKCKELLYSSSCSVNAFICNAIGFNGRSCEDKKACKVALRVVSYVVRVDRWLGMSDGVEDKEIISSRMLKEEDWYWKGRVLRKERMS